ncbi:MAG: DUF45 domain-containing protein [Erysipelotrichaceae bacterium]|nr:DUF45 domain-containing protein [Erysipelotrichaceae bacterium]
MEITLQGREIPVEIVVKKVKNVSLRITKEGTLRITCNSYVSSKQIRDFVYEKEEWILKSLAKVEDRDARSKSKLGEKIVYLFGDPYEAFYKEGSRNLLQIDRANRKAYFTVTQAYVENVEKAFDKAAKEFLFAWAKEQRYIYDEMIQKKGVKTPVTIVIRKMKGKWGVCYPARGEIRLNTSLLHYSEEARKAVLLHEYAHMLEANHSKRFYAIVEKEMPSYRKVMKELV